MNKSRTNKLTILLHARKEGYRLYRINQWSYVLKRISEKFGDETINIYWNSKNDFFTFMSVLDHPTKNRQQLVRKFLTTKSILELLDNPRKHTGKGYYKSAK